MMGQNPLEKIDHGDGLTLRLVKGSPFLTIQGEGPYAGHPAIFVRLHGCNLACTFCDTQFSNPEDPIWLTSSLISHIQQFFQPNIKLVVITGGEPLRQQILPLCHALSELDYRVQIETAGTLWVPGLQYHAEIVVSPKTARIHEKARKHAVAFKYIIDIDQQFADDSFVPITATQKGVRPRALATPRPGAPVYLSPCDTYDAEHNQQNMVLVAKLAIKHNVIAGVQMHKILAINEP